MHVRGRSSHRASVEKRLESRAVRIKNMREEENDLKSVRPSTGAPFLIFLEAIKDKSQSAEQRLDNYYSTLGGAAASQELKPAAWQQKHNRAQH